MQGKLAHIGENYCPQAAERIWPWRSKWEKECPFFFFFNITDMQVAVGAKHSDMDEMEMGGR